MPAKKKDSGHAHTPSTENVETVSAAIPEPAVEPPVPEPAPEPIAEPPAPEPIAEPPAPEPIAEPPAPEPIAEPPAPEPIAEPPAPETIAEPPAPETIAEPPAPETIAEPPAPEPIAEPSAPEPIAEPPAPIAEPPAPEPIAEPPAPSAAEAIAARYRKDGGAMVPLGTDVVPDRFKRGRKRKIKWADRDGYKLKQALEMATTEQKAQAKYVVEECAAYQPLWNRIPLAKEAATKLLTHLIVFGGELLDVNVYWSSAGLVLFFGITAVGYALNDGKKTDGDVAKEPPGESARKVECPSCHATPGQWCLDLSKPGNPELPPGSIHAKRLDKAKQMESNGTVRN